LRVWCAAVAHLFGIHSALIRVLFDTCSVSVRNKIEFIQHPLGIRRGGLIAGAWKKFMDESSKKILSNYPGRQSRSKLSPHSNLIWKLHHRGCPYREIANILSKNFDLTVAASTVFDFVSRLEKQRAQKTKPRKEKIAQTQPAVQEKPRPAPKAMSDVVRQRIEEFKQSKPQADEPEKVFFYDPEKPLTLRMGKKKP
jgi:transposase